MRVIFAGIGIPFGIMMFSGVAGILLTKNPIVTHQETMRLASGIIETAMFLTFILSGSIM